MPFPLSQLFSRRRTSSSRADPPEASSPPRRIRLFNLFDLIVLSEPEDIRRVEASGAITRLHAEKTKDVPAFLRFAMNASKWFNQETDAWFVGMEPKDALAHPLGRDIGYHRRIDYIRDRLATGYTRADVEQMAQLLQRRPPEDDPAPLNRKAVEIVNQRFFKPGTVIPDRIVESTRHTITTLPQVLNPVQYLRGRTANQTVIRWLQQSLDPRAHLGDSAHNVHVATQGFARMLNEFVGPAAKEHFDTPKAYLTSKPAVKALFRLAAKETRLEDELDKPLDKPLMPYKTLVVLNLENAAKKTGCELFMFGAGLEDRQCPFKKFCLQFMADTKKIVD